MYYILNVNRLCYCKHTGTNREGVLERNLYFCRNILRKMSDTYFGNLRKVGSSVDEGLTKLQATWNMPHVLLCNNNDETQNTAKQLIENLNVELKQLRNNIEESKNVIIPLGEAFTQELDEKIEEVDSLKKELDEIKVLFVENGYVEEPIENDFSDLNNQIESLSINNSYSFTKDVGDLTNSSTFENNCLNDSEIRQSVGSKTPITNFSYDMRKALLQNEPPIEPMYSPCYYKMLKK